MRRGEITTEYDMAAYKKGFNAISDLPIAIDDKSMPDFNQVERRIRQQAKSYKLSLVIIDYIQQLIIPGEKWLSRVQELTQITGRIKALSQELKIAILGCAQLNREAEKSSGGTPTLSMLKDCGSLEQDADIVMFVHRQDDDDMTMQLLVEKHRHDEAGVAFPLDMEMAFSRVKTAGEPGKIERRRAPKKIRDDSL
jgi:replicative DNA helicase